MSQVSVRICRTCGHGLTDQEREDYVDQCGPCALGDTDAAPPMAVWHDEADRLAAWGTLDPPNACMCRECVIPPAERATDE